MYTEDDLLPISALQHLVFCPRQCALIHVEGLWAENRLTVEGRQLHEKAHAAGDQARGDLRIARGLLLRSLRLGLYGKADVVEFRPIDTAQNGPGEAKGRQPFPIEYKRGKPKSHDADRVQLCAQALCLAEMLALDVPSGALFYGRTRRRLDVDFTADLRARTERAAAELHDLIAAGRIPPATRSQRCRRCSLQELCLPRATAPARSAAGYLRRTLARGGHTSPIEDADA
jgi:CRISPR-associated exonuclease Cas4